MTCHIRCLLVCALALLLAVPAWTQEKTCPKCNKNYGNEAKFCLDDGSLLTVVEKCPKCRAVRAGKAKYCAACGFDFEKPAAVTCAKCGKQVTPGTKFCVNCGAALPTGGSTGGGTGGTPGGTEAPRGTGAEISQWAESAVAATSQYGIRLFSKDQVAGAPDVERPGQDGRAWCPAMAKRGVESITVKFAKAVVPSALRIYETAAQGFVTRIDAITARGEVLIWEGQDATNPKAKVLQCVPGQGAPASDTYKITIDTAKVRTGWTEIDAVELVGSPAAPAGGTGGGPGPDREGGWRGGDIGWGPLGVRAGSELRYQVTRGGATETLSVRVHLLSQNSIGLAWTATGARETAGYVLLKRSALWRGGVYDDLFPAEQMDTIEAGSVLWVAARTRRALLDDGHATLDIAGLGQLDLDSPTRSAVNVAINGKPARIDSITATLEGGGRVTMLGDRGNPLVLDMERRDFRMTLQAADRVGGQDAPAETGTGTGAGTGSGTGTGPGTETRPPETPGLPNFATPDECFEAWKQAVSDGDAGKLAVTYLAAERKAMQDDGDEATQVFDRYRESIQKSKYSVESKKEVGSQTVWVVEVRVKELFWNRKAKDTFKFSKEGASWRLTIEKDGF